MESPELTPRVQALGQDSVHTAADLQVSHHEHLTLGFLFDDIAASNLGFISVRQAIESSVSSLWCSVSSSAQFHTICDDVTNWALMNFGTHVPESVSETEARADTVQEFKTSVHNVISELEAHRDKLALTVDDQSNRVMLVLTIDAIDTFKRMVGFFAEENSVREWLDEVNLGRHADKLEELGLGDTGTLHLAMVNSKLDTLLECANIPHGERALITKALNLGIGQPATSDSLIPEERHGTRARAITHATPGVTLPLAATNERNQIEKQLAKEHEARMHAQQRAAVAEATVRKLQHAGADSSATLKHEKEVHMSADTRVIEIAQFRQLAQLRGSKYECTDITGPAPQETKVERHTQDYNAILDAEEYNSLLTEFQRLQLLLKGYKSTDAKESVKRESGSVRAHCEFQCSQDPTRALVVDVQPRKESSVLQSQSSVINDGVQEGLLAQLSDCTEMLEQTKTELLRAKQKSLEEERAFQRQLDAANVKLLEVSDRETAALVHHATLNSKYNALQRELIAANSEATAHDEHLRSQLDVAERKLAVTLARLASQGEATQAALLKSESTREALKKSQQAQQGLIQLIGKLQGTKTTAREQRDLHEQLQGTQLNLDASNEERIRLEQEIQEWSDAVDARDNAFDEAEQQIIELQGAIGANQQRDEQRFKELTTAHMSVCQQLQDLQENLGEHGRGASEYGGSASTVSSLQAEMRLDMEANAKQIQEWQSAIEQRDGRIADLEESAEELDAWSTAVEERDARIDDLETLLLHAEDHATRLQTDAKESKYAVTRLESQLKATAMAAALQEYEAAAASTHRAQETAVTSAQVSSI